MKKSWKLIPIVALAIGLIIPASAPAAEDKEAFFPASIVRSHPNDKIFSIGEDVHMTWSSMEPDPDGTCKSNSKVECIFKDSKYLGAVVSVAMLNKCSDSENNDCIESIEISRDGKEYTKLTFDRYVFSDTWLNCRPNNCGFPPDQEKNLPRGGQLSVWSEMIDGKASEVKYAVSYYYQMTYDSNVDKFEIRHVGLGIKPFKEVNVDRWDSLWRQDGKSAIQYDFRSDLQFRATVHLSKTVAGWFKARMQDVDVEIEQFSNSNNRLTVSGKPVTIPTFAFKRALEELTPQEVDFGKYYGYGLGVSGGEPGDPRIFEYLEYWRPKLNDIATNSNTVWSLKSTRWISENKCLNDTSRVLGVVSTNSMGYEGTPPKFSEGFLNYRVSGLHYGPDGKKPNLGTYDLVLRSDAARCLYGFSNAPVSATVSVAGADGAQSVATTVVTEKDGWLKMKAAGFTFSEKQIKVKITQEPSAAIPVAVAKKKSAITCVKGKATKKVTAVSPKCPAGYKKKAQLKPRLV